MGKILQQPCINHFDPNSSLMHRKQ